MKTILFISGGIQAIAGIQRARQRGLHVVVSDGSNVAPGFAHADDHILKSTYDVDATVAAALRFHEQVRPIDGVMSVAADVAETVSAVAERLGLPGISPTVAHLVTDKLAMKQRLKQDGVLVPWFSAVTSAAELVTIVKEQGLPLVIKPVDSRGSRGVLRLEAGADLTLAFETSRAQSRTGRVMVELFLDGPQVSTESIVLDGVAYTPGFADRNYEHLERYAPHVIENGGDLPSILPQETQSAVCELVQRAAASLGIDNWVAKGDIVIHRGVPHVIEIAGRLSGGYFCTHEIPLATGVELVDAVIALCLGERVDPLSLAPTPRLCVCQRNAFPAPGRIVAIGDLERVRVMPGIAEVVLNRRAGDFAPQPIDSTASTAAVIASGATRQQALERAQAALAALEITTEAV